MLVHPGLPARISEMTIGYVEVDQATVPLRNRRAAVAALAFGRRDLALPPMTVRWFDLATFEAPSVVFTSAGATAVRGRCPARPEDLDYVWIRRGPEARYGRVTLPAMTPADTASVVLHECRHARDALDWGGTTRARKAESEANALEYERRHRRLVARMGEPGWP